MVTVFLFFPQNIFLGMEQNIIYHDFTRYISHGNDISHDAPHYAISEDKTFVKSN